MSKRQSVVLSMDVNSTILEATTIHFKGKENGKNYNEGFDNLHIILLIHVYALAKIRQLNRKERLENVRGTTLDVAMPADVSGAYSAISSV